MTPHELYLHIIAHNERETARGRDELTGAYLTAYWQRVKRMPDLKKILGEEQSQEKQQTPEDMLAVVKNLNAAFGGSVEV